MQVKGTAVSQYAGLGSEPNLCILFDEVPNMEDAVYQKRLVTADGQSAAYYAEKDGFVRYVNATTHQIGGANHTLAVRQGDGTVCTEVVRGAAYQETRAGFFNALGFGPCVDVYYADTKSRLTHAIGTVTLAVAQEAAKSLGLRLFCGDFDSTWHLTAEKTPAVNVVAVTSPDPNAEPIFTSSARSAHHDALFAVAPRTQDVERAVAGKFLEALAVSQDAAGSGRLNPLITQGVYADKQFRDSLSLDEATSPFARMLLTFGATLHWNESSDVCLWVLGYGGHHGWGRYLTERKNQGNDSPML